ncbi:MAG: toxin-antitoxin system, antitoxin component, Xre family protein [Clostridia bacterium]|nr:toxin-antitoxin system, antitoxin component, Xre family protein [Clostridia bacterium]
MTDTKALKEHIKSSGISIVHISRRLGISAAAFYNKLSNITQFKPTEISELCDILCLTQCEKEAIFFAQIVE